MLFKKKADCSILLTCVSRFSNAKRVESFLRAPDLAFEARPERLRELTQVADRLRDERVRQERAFLNWFKKEVVRDLVRPLDFGPESNGICLAGTQNTRYWRVCCCCCLISRIFTGPSRCREKNVSFKMWGKDVPNKTAPSSSCSPRKRSGRAVRGSSTTSSGSSTTRNSREWSFVLSARKGEGVELCPER